MKSHNWFDSVNAHLRAEADKARQPILNSSWAIWASPGPGGFTRKDDLSFPGLESARPTAHGRVIFLAMNPGTNRPERPRGDWSNFHSRGSNDHLLAEACRATELWGAFMTDLYFDQYESDPKRVDKSVRRQRTGVERLIKLTYLLGDPDPLIVCIGGDAKKGFHGGLRALNAQSDVSNLGRPPVLRSVGVSHYSTSNGGQHKSDPQLYRDEFFHRKLREAGHNQLLIARAKHPLTD